MSTTEKKTINYKGMKLPCITEGYWPKGVTLVRGNDINDVDITDTNIVCLCKNIAFYDDGETTSSWKYWAILPPRPAPRSLTRREVYALWRKGWDYCSASGLICVPAYVNSQANEYVELNSKLRAPNSDEWLEPTSDLLEVGE